jgi:hypothetical protein
VSDAFDHERCLLEEDIHINGSYLPGKVVVDYPGSAGSITCADKPGAIRKAVREMKRRRGDK